MSLINLSWLSIYLAREPRLIIDVGTFDAADAIIFKKRWPGCRVIAFEADPVNFAKIEEHGLARRTGDALFFLP